MRPLLSYKALLSDLKPLKNISQLFCNNYRNIDCKGYWFSFFNSFVPWGQIYPITLWVMLFFSHSYPAALTGTE